MKISLLFWGNSDLYGNLIILKNEKKMKVCDDIYKDKDSVCQLLIPPNTKDAMP